MQVEELSVKFTAEIEQFKKKTNEMSKQLGEISKISEKSREILKSAMEEPSKKAQQLSRDMTKLQQAFISEKNKIFEAQDKIEQYDTQMQKLSETHKSQLVDIDKARQHLSQLKESYSAIERVISHFGTDIPLSTQLEKAKEEYQGLSKELRDLKKQFSESFDGSVMFGGKILNTEETLQEITKIENKLKDLNVTGWRLQKLIEELGFDNVADEAKNLQKSIKDVESTYRSLQTQAEVTESKISELASKAVSENRKIESSQPKLDLMQSSIRHTSKELGEFSKFHIAASKLGSAFSSSFNFAKNAATRLASTLSSGISKLRQMHSHTGSLSSSFKKLSVAAGGLMLIKSIFGRLKSVVSEYLNSNEQLKAKVDGLKNAFGQALAPTIETVISVFDKLAPYILAASNLIGELLSKLSALAGLKRTSTALSGVAQSTKEVAKAQSELYGFDKITKQSDDSISSGSSSSSRAVTYEPAALGSWADKIKSAIEDGDWSAVGQTLGQKLNSVFDKINFSNIGTKVGKCLQAGFETVYSFLDEVDFENIGGDFADAINGIMDNVDFSLAGATFAKKWNVLTDIVSGFVKKFDFKYLGSSISSGINGWFDEIDFSKAGQTLGESVKGVLTTVNTALEGIDWQSIGRKCADFIRNIDWSGIVSSISEGIGAALGGIAGFLSGFFDGAWTKVKEYFEPYISGAGGNIVDGVFSGIIDALNDVGEWIRKNILDPFLKGFKEAFGIHSPSTVMAEMGGYLIDGLKSGMGDIWTNVKQRFTDLWTNITTWFDGKKESMSKKWNELTSGIKDKTANIKAHFSDRAEEIRTKWKNRTDEIKNKTASFKASFSDSVNDIKSKWKDRTDKINSKTASFKASFSDSVNDIKKKWKNRTDEIKNKTATISMTISDGVTSVVKNIINGIVSILNKAINAINKVLPSGMKISNINPPKLATGTVVPANFGETNVIVGDNKREIEVVSPLSVIKRAMYEVVSDRGGTSDRPQTLIVPIYIGNRKLSEVVIDDINKTTDSTGICPIRA